MTKRTPATTATKLLLTLTRLGYLVDAARGTTTLLSRGTQRARIITPSDRRVVIVEAWHRDTPEARLVRHIRADDFRRSGDAILRRHELMEVLCES